MIDIIKFIFKLMGFMFDMRSSKKKAREEFFGDIKHSLKKKSDAVRIYKASAKQSLSGFLKRKEILNKRGLEDKTVFEKSKDEEASK